MVVLMVKNDSKCKKILTIPTKISLHDNRCFGGYCECGKLTYFCETVKEYICCECCQKER